MFKFNKLSKEKQKLFSLHWLSIKNSAHKFPPSCNFYIGKILKSSLIYVLTQPLYEMPSSLSIGIIGGAYEGPLGLVVKWDVDFAEESVPFSCETMQLEFSKKRTKMQIDEMNN